ncbi:hypothetical protein L1887_13395 [Cichorium endivia]|nr:hypothetical protein L1887_13395 [Cichorium endivia]
MCYIFFVTRVMWIRFLDPFLFHRPNYVPISKSKRKLGKEERESGETTSTHTVSIILPPMPLSIGGARLLHRSTNATPLYRRL